MKPASSDRRMLFILPSAFLNSLGIGIVNLGMLWIVRDSYGASPAAVSVFASLWAMAYFVGCIVLRPLSPHLSARTSMAIMTLGSAVLLGIHGLFPSLKSAFLVYALYGFGTALFWPRIMGWLSEGLEGQALSTASGRFSLAWSSGGIIAPYLAGLLAERGLFLPLWAGVGIFALTGTFILLAAGLAPSPALVPLSARNGSQDRSTPLRYPAWIGVFLLYALVAVFFNIFPIYAKDELGLSESRIGFLLLIRAFATTFGFWFFGRFDFWHFRRGFLLWAVLAGIGLDLAFILIRSPLFFGLGMAAMGFTLALAYSESIFYGASGAPDREKRMTIHEALLTAGQIAGSLAGGAAYQAFSWSAAFVAIAAIMIAGLAAQVFLLKRRA